MPGKHVPLRKCMACNEMKDKKELIRLVRTKKDDDSVEISLDRTFKAPGRGAYLCKSPDCLKKVLKSRRIDRVFSHKVPEEVYAQLEEAIAVEHEQA